MPEAPGLLVAERAPSKRVFAKPSAGFVEADDGIFAKRETAPLGRRTSGC